MLQHSSGFHTMYQSLLDRIQSHQPSPTAEPEKIDSPLMSVPAPTPMYAATPMHAPTPMHVPAALV